MHENLKESYTDFSILVYTYFYELASKMKIVLVGEMHEMVLTIKEKLHTESVAYPRISVSVAKSFANGELKLAASTFDFLVAVTPYVDIAGKICADLNSLRRKLNLSDSKFNYALSQAIEKGLIHNQNGMLYSNFHEFMGANLTGRKYISIYSVMTEKKFMDLTLRDKRLFYYIFSSKVPGKTLQVKLVNLFKNKLKKPGVGIDYFQTQAELLESIDRLMTANLIHVSCKTSKKFIELDSVTRTKELKMVLGFKDSQSALAEKPRKKRITSLDAEDVLLLKINMQHFTEKVKNEASFFELGKKFENKGVYFDTLKSSTKNYFVNMKNSLYSHLGMSGLSIYHESLDTFIKDHHDSIEVYDENDKVYSIYRDYYLMPQLMRLVDTLATYTLKKHALSASQAAPAYADTLEKPAALGILDSLLVFLKKMDAHVSVVDRLKLANNISSYLEEPLQYDYMKDKLSYVYEQTVFLRKFVAEKALPLAEYSVNDFMDFLFDLFDESVITNDYQLYSLLYEISNPSPESESAEDNTDNYLLTDTEFAKEVQQFFRSYVEKN